MTGLQNQGLACVASLTKYFVKPYRRPIFPAYIAGA